MRAHPEECFIGVFDTSFLPKSGKSAWGLDKFFSHTAKAMRTGLEVSLLGVIATKSREAFALDATQTPPALSTSEHTPAYSRIDFYLEQITGSLERLPRVCIYTALAGSEHFKRDLRLVVLHNERDGSYVVLCSTDLSQCAEEVVAFYRLRYQLEFIIRDAKQFTGLTQCQARDEAKEAPKASHPNREDGGMKRPGSSLN